MNTNTYAVYTITLKLSKRGEALQTFSKKYEGSSLEDAEKAYIKLSGKPRALNVTIPVAGSVSGITRRVKGENFPE